MVRLVRAASRDVGKTFDSRWPTSSRRGVALAAAMCAAADRCLETQFVVVGAGPAGLQFAHLLQVKGYSYVVLEKEAQSAAFQARYPVHGRLISLNKRFVGSDDPELHYRQDWNSLVAADGQPLLFTNYTDKLYPDRDLLRQYLIDWQEQKALAVMNSVAVQQVQKYDGKFLVIASNGMTYKCTYLVMATGAVGPYAPRAIQGIELSDGYEDQTARFENREYRDKRVLIIGKGNSAFETADFLSSQAAVIHLVSRHHIKQAWDTHFVGHLRSVNNNVLDMYQLKAQVAILNARVESITAAEGGRFGTKYIVKVRADSRARLWAQPCTMVVLQHIYVCPPSLAPFCAELSDPSCCWQFGFTDTPDDPFNTIEYDAVIRATGWRYIKPEIFCPLTCKVATTDHDEMDGRFPELNSAFESQSVPNLLWIGASTQGRRFKQDTSGFIHGFRYLCRVTLAMLEARDFGHSLATAAGLPLCADSISAAFLKRMNISSALYQMQSTLCDVCTFSAAGGRAAYFEELPLSFVMERIVSRQAPLDSQFAVVGILKYGNRGDVDAFRYKLEATPSHPERSVFLHPYFETYMDGTLVRSLHLLENLETEFVHEEYHVRPLREHLKHALLLTRSKL